MSMPFRVKYVAGIASDVGRNLSPATAVTRPEALNLQRGEGES